MLNNNNNMKDTTYPKTLEINYHYAAIAQSLQCLCLKLIVCVPESVRVYEKISMMFMSNKRVFSYGEWLDTVYLLAYPLVCLWLLAADSSRDAP